MLPLLYSHPVLVVNVFDNKKTINLYSFPTDKKEPETIQIEVFQQHGITKVFVYPRKKASQL
ncbi:MAG: hypothetical protein WBF39_05885 [Planococcus donghaensis]